MATFTKEQLEVIMHEQGDILVSASAGSGKTHTMIERLKRLIILGGVNVSEVLAVTFTEAAAADMKEKLKNALTDAINGKLDKEIYEEVPFDAVERLRRELKEVATADISTMHSFCGRLIRTYFFAAGVSPDFKIIDQAESAVYKKACIERTFKEFYDGGEEWFLRLVDRHARSRSDQNLRELILSAYEFCDSEAHPEKLYQKYQSVYTQTGYEQLLNTYKASFNDNIKELIDECNFALKIFTVNGREKAANLTSALIRDMRIVCEEKDVYKLMPFKDYKIRFDVERKLTAEEDEQKEIVKAARDKFIKILSNTFSFVGDNFESDKSLLEGCKEHTEWLCKVIERFGQIYSAEKREENCLDFNDLEHFTLKILEQEEYRSEISKRYKYIFIDEYQDTNGVQDEIISLIGNDNVFMVGDDKQSIYGFRGSSSKFFSQKLLSMNMRGQKVVRLNDNFRSADKVIQTVNAIFNHCMTEDGYGLDYKNNSQLKAGGVYPVGADGRAEIHFLEKESAHKKPKEERRIYDVIKENPEQVDNDTTTMSALLAEIIESELGKSYYDAKSKQFKNVGYGDIAILTRSRNSKYVSDLVSGLIRNGVPVVSDVKENVCDFSEIQMLINALKLVDCFLQDYPLASTLKSPIGNFTEEELLEIVNYFDDNNENSYGSFSDAYNFYLDNKKECDLKKRLVQFDEYFKKLRLISDFIGAHGVLTRLINDNDIFSFLYAEKAGELKVDRVKRLLAACINDGKILTVKELISRVNDCPDAFGLSPFGSEDNVKLMTIHSSKGLEFPVVIACGLERSFNDEDLYDEVLFSRDFGFAVYAYDDQKRVMKDTLLRQVIKAQMAEEMVKEEMRLFYVATTRATYSLHLTVSAKNYENKVKAKHASCFAHFIPSILTPTEHSKNQISMQSLAAEIRKVYIINPDLNEVDKMRESYAFSYPFQSDTVLPLKGSVTSVMKNATEESAAQSVFTIDVDEVGSTDTERGTIAHKILELFNFASGKDIFVQTQEMVEKGILTAQEIEKIDLTRLNIALSGGAFSGLKEKKLYRERSFLVDIEADKILQTDSSEKVLLQGVIDLLVIGDSGAEIIDYKYSLLNGESLKARYKKQLDLYAYAVEKLLDLKVVKKSIVNVFTGQTVILD